MSNEIDSIVCEILDIIGGYWDDEVGTPRKSIKYGDLIKELISFNSYETAKDSLGVSLHTLERALIPIRQALKKPKKCSWDTFLLLYIDSGKCITCKSICNLVDMSARRGSCKACDSIRSNNIRSKEDLDVLRERGRSHYRRNKAKYIARNAIKRKRIQQATPKWANLDIIQQFYLNRPEGYHVDHIIPLKGPAVCGLHIESNLQYLPAAENRAKSNSFNSGLTER
jgi:hypothetical protein